MLKAFIFGITVALTIGPIALLVVNNAINHGLRAGVRSALGAALADLCFALIAFSLGAQIALHLETYRPTFMLVSSVVLLVFGLWMMFKAMQGLRLRQQVQAAPAKFGLRTTFILTVISPLTIVLFAAFAGQTLFTGSLAETVTLAVAVFSGSFLAQVILAGVGAILRLALQNPKLIWGLNMISGLGMTLFGLTGILF